MPARSPQSSALMSVPKGRCKGGSSSVSSGSVLGPSAQINSLVDVLPVLLDVLDVQDFLALPRGRQARSSSIFAQRFLKLRSRRGTGIFGTVGGILAASRHQSESHLSDSCRTTKSLSAFSSLLPGVVVLLSVGNVLEV